MVQGRPRAQGLDCVRRADEEVRGVAGARRVRWVVLLSDTGACPPLCWYFVADLVVPA